MVRQPRFARSTGLRPSPRARVALLAIVALAVLGPLAAPVAAVENLTMSGRVLLEGHGRSGSWMAVAVDLANGGPPITGELRLAGGATGRTRFGTPVDLPTGSRKTILLYGQPPAFGQTAEVALVAGDQAIETVDVAIALHEPSQLVVGILAEEPARIVADLDLLPDPNGRAPVIVPLGVEDLPERVEAWSTLDRLVWQDVDSGTLSSSQLAAMRGWIAAGGRLVIAGGTTGIDALAALPDEILPYRPTGTIDVDPTLLAPLLGSIPDDATPVPAMAGELSRGRLLAASGDRVVAAETPFGSGSVTLLGFDPASAWIAGSDSLAGDLWRRFLPPRGGSATPALSEDGSLVSAVQNLPSLALPPIGGLLVLLLGYIILVGPVNYLVLRWLDRREWAWATIPALIVVFTVGAFGFGSVLRGSDLIVHEVAIVRGAPGTSDAVAQSYLGLFSPSRATYQIEVPGGALLSAPVSGDFFGGDTAGPLDVLQGDPARVRNLQIGFGSLRTVRAEAPVAGPVIEADLRVEDGRLVGAVRNQSDRTLDNPAVVLGASAIVLPDLAPGAQQSVDLPLVTNPLAQPSLVERVVGQLVFNNPEGGLDEEAQRRLVRRGVIEQLTYDPTFAIQTQLNNDSAVLLAWGSDPVMPFEVVDQRTRRVANVLYHVPLPVSFRGTTVFRSDLLRSSVIEIDAVQFSKDPWSMAFGPGRAHLAYRPIPFQGTFDASRVVVGMNFGGDLGFIGESLPRLEPAPPCEGDGCEVDLPPGVAFLPRLEMREVATGEWVRFQPLDQGRAYELPDPDRWVDSATGEVDVRFVNEGSDVIGFGFGLQLEGVVG